MVKYVYGCSTCRVLTATKANKTERFIRSSALLDTKSTHSLNARSHCSVPVCPARTTAVRYALLLIQPLYTTPLFTLTLRSRCSILFGASFRLVIGD